MRHFIVIFSILFFTNGSLYAQCCAQGTPMGGAGNLGTLPKGSFQVVSFYNFSQSKSQKDDNPYYITGADFNFVGLSMSYGILPKLTAELELGYFINKTQYYSIGSNNYNVRGYGLSNGFFSLKYGLFKSRNTKWEIVGGLGIKFPFSTEYQIVNNVQLPIDNQPSTCGYGIAPKFLIFRKFAKQDLNLFLIHRTDYNFKNANEYTYGHGFTTSIFAAKKLNFISCNALGVLQFKSIVRTQDIKPDGNFLETTGSNTFFVAPQFGYTFFNRFFISATYELPIYQEFNTEKLKYRHAFTFSMVYSLNRKEKEPEKSFDVSDSGSNGEEITETFMVYGECGMCKDKIESTLLSTDGVESANWNVESKMLTVSYDPSVISQDGIKEELASIGYDTDTHRATKKAYKSLHPCCQYERPQ